MTEPLPLPIMKRCPYCGHKLASYTSDNPYDHTHVNLSHTYCPNDRCCTNGDYRTLRGAINAANRRPADATIDQIAEDAYQGLELLRAYNTSGARTVFHEILSLTAELGAADAPE